MAKNTIPDLRLRVANERETRTNGDYVLYWMIAARRTRYNFGLQRAVELAKQLGKPLVVLEALRCDYRWASDRLHKFVLDGMRDNARALEKTNVRYFPYVEPRVGAGKGLLRTLAEQACVVVTDEFPSFFLPRMVASAAAQVSVRMEVVDSNGLLPLRATQKVFARAHDFRRFLQRELAPHLFDAPRENPLARVKLPALRALPKEVGRWPEAGVGELSGERLAALPIDHGVAPAESVGGMRAGKRVIQRFLDDRLPVYGDGRNHPDADASSGLSPYLHFGHVSPHEVLLELARREDWSPNEVSDTADGGKSGWWNMSTNAESFLDELVTWREVGYNMAANEKRYDRFSSLPEWARTTLGQHESDPRPHEYGLAAFERAETHDPIWNAAQTELRERGAMHNYLRMLWGKKVLHWSKSPERAASILIELNNKYALDGRNPNSYSGIYWIFGRYDRAWGPERPVFGKVRYMSSANTKKKLHLADYLARWGGSGALFS